MWIEPTPGYSPVIGRLVCMLTYARERTLAAVDGLTVSALDFQYDAKSNSIGALLAHVVAVERAFQILSFENRELSAAELVVWQPALDLGTVGRERLVGQPVQHYADQLAVLRRATLAALCERDDAWLEQALPAAPELNAHWAWFHVVEDETSHRGQIQWLKARMTSSLSAARVP